MAKRNTFSTHHSPGGGAGPAAAAAVAAAMREGDLGRASLQAAVASCVHGASRELAAHSPSKHYPVLLICTKFYAHDFVTHHYQSTYLFVSHLPGTHTTHFTAGVPGSACTTVFEVFSQRTPE